MKILIKPVDCIVVPGKKYGLICDLTRRKYYRVERKLIQSIRLWIGKPIHSLHNTLMTSETQDFFQFCIEHEILIEVDPIISPFFSKKRFQYQSPETIHSIVIQSDSISTIQNVSNHFIQLGCKNIQLICLNTTTKHILEVVTNWFIESSIDSIELYFNYTENLSEYITNENLTPRIRMIVLNESPFNKQINMRSNIILYTQEPFNFRADNLNPSLFQVEINSFLENKSYNGYFNKKLFIDEVGDVYTTYKFDNKIGHYTSVSEEKIRVSTDLNQLWNASKNKTYICKNCEYKYICPDKRVPIFHKEKKLYQLPGECNYNPETGKWTLSTL